MDEAFQEVALEAIEIAMDSSDETKEIAKSIKAQLEEQFDGPFQVVVGTDFGR